MATVKKGSLTRAVAQPDRTVTLKNDYQLEGDVQWTCDSAFESSLPGLFSAHPDDPRLILFQSSITRSRNARTIMSANYIGIAADPTPYQISWPSSGGQDPIETHPNFADFAGTPASPLNGAVFDPENDQFLGFFDNTSNKMGVSAYLVANPQVYLSYWTYRRPNPNKLFSIRGGLPTNILEPSSVKNWMLIGQPYEKIGELYHVTEQYLGSGPNGWDTDIYD